MRIPISQARQKLTRLVRQIQKNPELVFQLTVRGQVMAELGAASPEPEPGAAARALLQIARNQPMGPRPRTNISEHIKEYLHGRPKRAR